MLPYNDFANDALGNIERLAEERGVPFADTIFPVMRVLAILRVEEIGFAKLAGELHVIETTLMLDEIGARMSK